MTTKTARPANFVAAPKGRPQAGPGSLNGQAGSGTRRTLAVEGQDSPQAINLPPSTGAAPAGSTTAQPAIKEAIATATPLAGRETSRDHGRGSTHTDPVPAASIPAGHLDRDSHGVTACGDQDLPAPAMMPPASTPWAPGLADPFLALAADVLDDLEKVRVANENRLRQLTRSPDEADRDGETGRGFGLGLTSPAVSRLAVLIRMMKCNSEIVLRLTGEKLPKRKGCCLEHDAERNLTLLLRDHPLGSWMAGRKGIGAKQGARLLAAVGDPYIRPQIERRDGTVEPSRPRRVSELWALAGYHVVKIPVSNQGIPATHTTRAADGPASRPGQTHPDAHGACAGAGPGSHPGQATPDAQSSTAGVAARRQRGSKANWSGTARMRAHLVAESCIKQRTGHYRPVYDATRLKYEDAVHQVECVRCGPKGKPAQPGSPLSDGHKHARGLRAVAKEILRDLWRAARRQHQSAPGSQYLSGTQFPCAAGGGGEGGQS